MLAGLIRDGLVTASHASVGRWLVDVVRIKITDAGRAALSEQYDPPSRSASGTTEPSSILAVNPIMAKTNGKAEEEYGLEDERRNLAKEILRLSPPQPGCEQRARFILERKFTLEELRVLAEALRDGFGLVVKPEQT